MYKVFMPLRTQTCSNDVLSVYSSAVTNSSERSGATEGSEMQDWRLQSSIIVTTCTWKRLSYCHREESLMQAACTAGNRPWRTSMGRIPPPDTWEIQTFTYLGGPVLSTHISTIEMWKSSTLTSFLPPLVPCPGDWQPHQPHWSLFSSWFYTTT